MRRVPFDRRAQELRRGERPLRHAAGRRSASAAKPATARARAHVAWAQRAAELVAVRQERGPDKGLLVRFDERRGVTWAVDPKTGNAAAQLRRRRTAQGGRDLRAMPRAARRILRGLGAGPLAVRHARRLGARPRALSRRRADARRGLQLRLVQAEQDVRGRRHLQRLPRPAQRQAALAGDERLPAMPCAERYASRRASPPRERRTRRSAACPATCRRGPTWWSTSGTITASAFRGPICPASSARRNACNDCHTDKPPHGRPPRSRAGSGRTGRACRTTPRPSMRPGHDAADAAALLAAVAADRQRAGLRARRRACASSRRSLSPANVGLARTGLRGSRPDGAHRRARHARRRAAGSALAAGLAAAVRSDPRRAHPRGLAARRRADREPACRADRETLRARGGRVHRRAAVECRPARKRARRSAIFYARRGQTAEAEAEFKAALRLSPQYAPAAINLADLYRQLGRDARRRRRAARGDRRLAAGCRAASCARACAGAAEAAGRGARRACAAPPSSSLTAPAMPMSMRSGSNSAGRRAEAIQALKDNLARHPADRDTLSALISFSRDAGDFAGALKYAEQLAQSRPEQCRAEKPDRDAAARGGEPRALAANFISI